MVPVLDPSAANYRAECARYKISHSDLADAIGMNRQQLSMMLSGSRKISSWAVHNISLGINQLVGAPIFRLAVATSYIPADRRGTISRGKWGPKDRSPLNPLILANRRRPKSYWPRRKRKEKI